MPLNPKGLTKGLIERIRQKVRQVMGDDGADQDAVPDPLLSGSAAGDINTILYRIRTAARAKTKLWMLYNNTWRHVEPYSFRYRSKGQQPLFYGWCEIHDHIEAYRVDRIQDVQVTDRPFAPRFNVEIA